MMPKKKSKRRKNLKIQLHKKINDLLRIGESKHEAKKEYRAECEKRGLPWNPSKSPYIHSIKTTELYRGSINDFSEWLKSNRRDVWNTKDLNSITKEICYEYLKYKDKNGSAWSTSRHMAALNKVLDHGLNKKDGDLKSRRNKNITRSRSKKENDFKYNPENYKDQIEISKAFGLRRESICDGDFAIKESSIFKEDDKIYIAVIEKGGKYREALCLDEYKKTIIEKYDISERQYYDKETFVDFYNNSDGEQLFDNYTKKIDNHSFRRQYAQKLYKQLEENQILKHGQVEKDYRGFNKNIILKISHSLGHNRPDIVIDHYLN